MKKIKEIPFQTKDNVFRIEVIRLYKASSGLSIWYSCEKSQSLWVLNSNK